MGKYDGDKRYDQFLTARHQQAIQADLRLLHWASRHMAMPQ
jgi:hypothetical protein